MDFSFLGSWGCSGGNFIKFHRSQCVQVGFFRVSRRLEYKGVCLCWNVGFPFLDLQGILRRASQRLARDYVFSGDRTRPALDPYLPVSIAAPECEVLAFDTVDNPLADVPGVGHI